MNPDDREELLARLTSKLEPWRLRATLGFAGLYLLTHEMIKDVVVPRVKGFFLRGFDQSGFKYDDASYQSTVLNLAPGKPFKASLLWLADMGAITQSQAARLDAIYAHRHDLTHELAKYLVDPDFEPDTTLFGDALEILSAIHKFWTQIEIDTGWLDEHGDISADDVTPATILLLDLCIDAYVDGLRAAPSDA